MSYFEHQIQPSGVDCGVMLTININIEVLDNATVTIHIHNPDSDDCEGGDGTGAGDLAAQLDTLADKVDDETGKVLGAVQAADE